MINLTHYQHVADCIRSGQVSYTEMLWLFTKDELFKVWYKHKYCIDPACKDKPKVFM